MFKIEMENMQNHFFEEELYLELLKKEDIYNMINKQYKGISYKKIKTFSLKRLELNLIKTYIYLNSKNNYNKYFYNGFNIQNINDYLDNYSYSSIKLTNKLIDLYKENKDTNIRDILIYSHQFIVMKYVLKKTDDMNLLVDLLQEGNIGLLYALEAYKTNASYPFYSYASWYVKKYINWYIEKNNCQMFRGLNNSMFNKEIYDYLENYKLLNNKYPSYEEICNKFNISKEEYIDIYNSYNVISYNEIDDDVELIENISDDSDFRELVEDSDIYNRVLEVIKQIVKKNGYIGLINSISENPKTYDELGKELNVSRQAVEQTHKRALKKVRNNERVKRLLK